MGRIVYKSQSSFNFQYAQVDIAPRRLDDDIIANAVAEQRFANGGFVGDTSITRVSLFRTNQMICLRGVRAFLDSDVRTNIDNPSL